MIIRSEAPVPIAEFTPGWADAALLGQHALRFVVAAEGNMPEFDNDTTLDRQTIEIAGPIIESADADYRSLGYARKNQPTYHNCLLRVGNVASSIQLKNSVLIETVRGLSLYEQIPTKDRLGNTRGKVMLPGNSLLHKDGPANDPAEESVQYTMSNMDGTVHYDQKFLNPLGFLERRGVPGQIASVIICAFAFRIQANYANLVQLEDNLLYRSDNRSSVHAQSSPFRPWRKQQRIFVRDVVSLVPPTDEKVSLGHS